jgi:transmembrane sensor
MEIQRIAYLLDRYQKNLATPVEMDEWQAVVTDAAYRDDLAEVLNTCYYTMPESEMPAMDGTRQKEIFEFIVHQRPVQQAPVRRLWPRYMAAAIALFVLGITFLLVRNSKRNDQDLSVATAQIHPGKPGAQLKLANGRVINLSEAGNGALAKEAGVLIRKNASGQISYQAGANNEINTGQLNALTTAAGETYMVELPDGTKVWLNAASALKYPASFNGNSSRVVELQGEAYFEVAKDKTHPFVVKSAQQEITVLGTHFDINGYADNDVVKTTLLEGSVAVKLSNSAKAAAILKPDQQASVSSGSVSITDVEAADAVSWKNGYFLFNNEELGSIMKTLSRWYGTTIVYDDETLKHEVVFAKLSRYESISKILKLMERTDKIKFKVDGTTITISRPKH